MDQKEFTTVNRYRGSTDGFTGAAFHKKVDGKVKGGSISLFKTKNGMLIGGYTGRQWRASARGEYLTDSTAMLFNLTTNNKFIIKDSEYAIQCSNHCGPNFGLIELAGYNEPFNGENNCHSYVNSRGYAIPKGKDGTNMLTNEKCENGQGSLCKFTIVELEVWEVMF